MKHWNHLYPNIKLATNPADSGPNHADHPSLDSRISRGDWLKSYLHFNNLKSFVVGVSGGIDSAVTSTLCAQTGERTILMVMPIHRMKDRAQAERHIDWLKNNYPNVEEHHVDLTDAYETLKQSVPPGFHKEISFANSQARLRMTALYLVAGATDGIVVGTGNKVEDFGVGFFTKHGDGGVDISPIGDLMKSEVRALAVRLGIAHEILVSAPTDGLWNDDRTDEEQLGVSYDMLEWAMLYNPTLDKSPLTTWQKRVLEIYHTHRNNNMHKMKEVPVYNGLPFS